jgi:peptide/nickel transport system permease protein
MTVEFATGRARTRPLPKFRSFSTAWYVAAAVLAFFVFLAFFGPLFLQPASAIDPGNLLAAPSLGHPLGTDEVGRDLLSRIANAGRLTLTMGLGAMALAVILGGIWGMCAAAFGGWLDEILMRLADALIAIPVILFALVFVAALGATVPNLIVILGILMAPTTARIVRSAVLGELVADYVLGLRAVGTGTGRILFLEVLPNIRAVVLAQATLNIATAVMVEAGLSFVGLGVQPPDATWGTILKQGYSSMTRDPTYVIFPALAIIAFIASLNVLSKETQRMLNQRSF